MINVLHIIEDLGLGGAERRLMNDLKYLDRRKFSNVICSLQPNVQIQESYISDIPIYCFNVKSLVDIFVNLLPINKIIKRHNIDIIHTQLFWADSVGRILKILHKKTKLITTIQSTAHENNNSELYSYKRKKIDSITGRLCNDGYIAVSDYVKDISIKNVKFRRDKIRVIYNSVDLSYITSESKIKELKAEFKITPGQKTLLTIGRLVPAKGHSYLIEAMPEIKKKIPDIKLLIVGVGSDKERLIKRCDDLNLSDTVLFIGRRKDARDIISICDIFIFPTLYGEGLSVALLEAVALKVPCIATSIKQNMEIIKHGKNGLLVDCGDSKAISDAVIYLFDHPEEIRRFGYNGSMTVNEKFCASANAKALEEYYINIISKGQKNRNI